MARNGDGREIAGKPAPTFAAPDAGVRITLDPPVGAGLPAIACRSGVRRIAGKPAPTFAAPDAGVRVI